MGIVRARDDSCNNAADPPRVDRHGHVDVLVGVHADDHLPRVGLDSPWVRHRVASSGADASAGWADRTVRVTVIP